MTKITLRYDELKVRYNDDSFTAMLITPAGEQIVLPIGAIKAEMNNVYMKFDSSAKLSWKDYRVDLVHDNWGWVIYYPTTYKNNGYYYKIRADLYYEENLELSEVPANVPNEMTDAVYERLRKRTEYKTKIYYNQAPEANRTSSAFPSEIAGKDIEITPVQLWIKTGDHVESMSFSEWRIEYTTWTPSIKPVLECFINNTLCFVEVKHLNIS